MQKAGNMIRNMMKKTVNLHQKTGNFFKDNNIHNEIYNELILNAKVREEILERLIKIYGTTKTKKAEIEKKYEDIKYFSKIKEYIMADTNTLKHDVEKTEKENKFLRQTDNLVYSIDTYIDIDGFYRNVLSGNKYYKFKNTVTIECGIAADNEEEAKEIFKENLKQLKDYKITNINFELIGKCNVKTE